MRLPSLTPEASALADALRGGGFDALVVGGAVRDALLGRPGADLDFVTSATPEQVRELARDAAWARTTFSVGERFGTLGIVLADGDTVEVSRYRPDALAQATVERRFAIDAGHRDFTINALAFDLANGTLLDPLDGQADLETKVLRAPLSPAERFAEDPLRVLRTARFVAELGFEVDDLTSQALPPIAPLLKGVAVERVRDELTKLLLAPFAERALFTALDSGALDAVLPEVAALDGVTQPTFHDLDVFAHTAMSVGLTPATPVLRWAALLHDIGKAPARTVEPDGRIRFFRHSQIGAAMAERICVRLRMSNADTTAITHLVAEHMRLGDVDFDNPRSVDRAVRKLDLWAGNTETGRALATAEDAVELTLADFAATAHREDTPLLRAHLERAIAASRERGTRVLARSPVSGAELMRELGIAEGPDVGVAKDAVEQAIDGGAITPDDREGALRVARTALGYHPDTTPRPLGSKEQP